MVIVQYGFAGKSNDIAFKNVHTLIDKFGENVIDIALLKLGQSYQVISNIKDVTCLSLH